MAEKVVCMKGWDSREGCFREPKRVMEALCVWQRKDGVERLREQFERLKEMIAERKGKEWWF